MSDASTTQSGVLYREHAFPPVIWWIVAALISGMTLLIVYPVWPAGGVATPFVVCAAVFFCLYKLSPAIVVTEHELFAGPAHISHSQLGEVRALDVSQTAWECGPGLDARAFLHTRPWLRTAVRITLHDPEDPTPYWIISTRRPEQLARVLAG